MDRLLQFGISPESGYVANRLNRVFIDLSDNEGQIDPYHLDGSYTNFVARTVIPWGTGPQNDACGFVFRLSGDNSDSDTDFYYLAINREGVLYHGEVTNNNWIGSYQRGNGSAIHTQADDINELVLVAIEDTFEVYVNGQLSLTFQDSTHTNGIVGLVGETYNSSATSYCSFTDSWVWDIAHTVPESQLNGVIDADTSVNLRSGAGQEFETLTTLPTGMPIQILQESFDRRWLYIRAQNNRQGWVAANLVQRE